MASENDLKLRITQLEAQLSDREQDLKIYKDELAKANQELRGLIDRVGEQLRRAHRLQKLLVPTEFPNIQGFEFSTKFQASSLSGGDYFDIFEHYDKMRFGLFLSSASGYGMSALFLSILMRMTYDIEDSKNRDPSYIMAEIVRELTQEGEEGDHAAIFYGVFDRRKFQLSYCNLGQPLMIHYESQSGELRWLDPHADAHKVGQELPVLKHEVIDLNPKDKLILCSTGFLELESPEGDTWGIEDVLSVVKANINRDVHELRNEIFFQAQKFSATPSRDLTVIVTEVKERIMKLAH